jgi:hypothetical protein
VLVEANSTDRLRARSKMLAIGFDRMKVVEVFAVSVTVPKIDPVDRIPEVFGQGIPLFYG